MQSYLGTVHMLCRQQSALGGHRDTHPDCMTEQEEKGLLAAQQTKMGGPGARGIRLEPTRGRNAARAIRTNECMKEAPGCGGSWGHIERPNPVTMSSLLPSTPVSWRHRDA